MKKHIVLSVTAIFILGASAFAHPPKDFKPEYDKATKTLKIVIEHGVKDSAKHFIDDVKISLNGSKIISQVFKSQTNNDGQNVIYAVVDADANAKLTIDADCNLMGSLKKDYSIKEISK